MKVINLLESRTTTGAGGHHTALDQNFDTDNRTFQAVGQTTSSTGSATIEIDVSNDGVHWLALGLITLSLSTTPSTDGFSSTAPWAFTRADVKSISGAGASVSVTMGV